MAISLPQFLGRYEVREEIARGGFAEVVLAWDEELQSSVAIKILRSEFLCDRADIKQRFLDEARLLRRIRSPNIVTIHDIGRLEDGRPYFVMDFADRGTLAARFDDTALRLNRSDRSLSALVDAIADGLSAMHEAGVVHRDIKPANILFQRVRRASPNQLGLACNASDREVTLVATDERILLGDLGIAKDMLRSGASSTLIGGTPLYRSPEQSEEGAEISPAADVYASTALLWEAIARQKPPQAHAVVGSLSMIPPAWRDFFSTGMSTDPESRFTSIEIWRSEFHALSQESSETVVDLSIRADQAHETKACPYKGLASYQPEDACSFFGREVLIDELVRRIQVQKVLIVGGASGSGKSSLVRAGLIPALKAGAIMGSDTWQVVLMTPGRDPMAELHFQLSKFLPEGTRSPVSLEDLLARPALARHLGEPEGARRPIILCIDQFEELFTLASLAQRGKFIEALSAMTDPAQSAIRIVVTVRADFYGACAQVPWLAERITDNQVLVGPMTDAELRRAITEPARRAGLHLERSLVDAIISEAGNESGALPLVAHALVETWIRRKGNTLTIDGFRAAGGVAGAISQTADITFERRFDEAAKEASKRLFLRLVTPGEGASDARRILARSEIDHDPGLEVMHRVVEELTEARLLTVNDTTIQIAHEALLRTWPRLRDWIEESRDNLRTRQRISRAAEEWETEGREPDRLYHGAPLLSALEWVEKNEDQLGAQERAFIDASEAARVREKLQEEEQLRRSKRIRRIATGVLAVLALGATIASVIAFMAFQDAQRNRETADLATTAANERFALALGAVANKFVADDPLLALYLTAEALTRAGSGAPGYDARVSLLAARDVLSQGGPVLLGSPVSMGDARVLALSPDGRVLAAGDRSGSIVLLDTATRKLLGAPVQAHKGGVEDLDFGPEGRTLVSAGDDGKVLLWTVNGAISGDARVIARFKDVVWGVRFDQTGSRVATAAEDGSVRLLDIKPGAAPRAPLTVNGGAFFSVAFSPDGHGLVAGNFSGEIFGWALADGKPLFSPIRDVYTSHIWKLVFNPAGTTFATSSSDGKAVYFSYPTGRVLGAVTAEGEIASGVAFSADGSTLIGGDASGALWLQDLRDSTHLSKTPKGHDAPVTDVKVSAVRNILVTLAKDKSVRFWRLEGKVPLATELRVPGHAAKGLALSRDGALLAAGDDDGNVSVWRVGSSQPAKLFYGHRQQVWAMAFSPDGSRLISGDRSGELRIWDVKSGMLVRSIDSGAGALWSIAVSPNGKQFLTASESSLRLWDMNTYAPGPELPGEDGGITRAAWSVDGVRVAGASTTGRVRIWNIKSGIVERVIPADRDTVWSVAFSPDGKSFATASGDEVVHVWNLANGEQTAAFAGHTGGATDVAYSGDGASIIAIDRRGALHFWDISTGRLLIQPLPAHMGASWRIVMFPDGQRFVTSGDDGLVKVWNTMSVGDACKISVEAFDDARRKEYLGDNSGMTGCANLK